MPWDQNRKAYEQAALLIAQGELTLTVIAERVDVARETLYLWRKEPEFRQLVANHREELNEEVRSFGIGQKYNRIKALQDRQRRLQQIIEERALSEQMQNVPGGTTGLLVHNAKLLGTGKDAERIDLYEVDTGLLAEIRAHELQAAKELGDWTDKSETKTEATVQVVEELAEWVKAKPEPVTEADESQQA